jgi:glycosyltransferase involved in cell wall biosynthesis
MPKLIRIATSPISFKLLAEGQNDLLRKNGWEVLLVSADRREISQILKSEGCKHQIIPFTEKQFAPIQDLKCLLSLVNLFKKERPDIVHSHTAKAGWLSMLAAKFAGVKTRIYSPSESSLISSKHKPNLLHQKMEQITFELATDIWIDSLGLKSLILDRGLCTMEKLHIHHRGSSNGIDLSKFNRYILQENHLVAATMRILPNPDDFIVLYVGGNGSDSGLEVLIKSFSSFQFQNQAKLVILGEFDQNLLVISPEMKAAMVQNPRIIQVDRKDHVEYYMALSDVLVHPSTSLEFQNVLLEAGAMQLPIICSDGAGNRNLISSSYGLIFPSGDDQALKEGLEFAFVKKQKMAQLAENLFQVIERDYARATIHQEILDAYLQRLEAVAR